MMRRCHSRFGCFFSANDVVQIFRVDSLSRQLLIGLFDGLSEVVAPGVKCVFVSGGVVGER